MLQHRQAACTPSTASVPTFGEGSSLQGELLCEQEAGLIMGAVGAISGQVRPVPVYEHNWYF